MRAPGGLPVAALAVLTAAGGCAVDFNRYLDAGADGSPLIDRPVLPVDDGPHPRSDSNVIALRNDGASQDQVVSSISGECVLYGFPPVGCRMARLAVAR